MATRTAQTTAGLLFALALTGATALAQPAPPAPGTTKLDTNGDGTQDVSIVRTDTDGVGGTDQVHIDANNNGKIDAGERVFNGVVGYMIVNGVLTIVEDTGTERVKTVIVPLDKTGDGDCDDEGEVTQRNTMADGIAAMQVRLLDGTLLSAQLAGSTTFEADLNAIAPIAGRDAIPIEIVALSLTGVSQPIQVTLQPLQPSLGFVVETTNVTNGSLDGRLFAPAGTVESFFDVFAQFDVAGARLVPQGAVTLRNTGGAYPPDPIQTYVLVNGPIPLVDAAGQLAGFLERFDFTPHVAPRLPCNCEKVTIKPVVKTEKGKPQVVVSPEPDGAVSGDDKMVYEVEIVIDWEGTIKCDNAGKEGCEANFALAAKSENWRIDNKVSAPVGADEFKGPDVDGKFVCTGRCNGEGVFPVKRTTYKVKVKKGGGGEITGKITGTITLAMTPTDCVGDTWTMVLAYAADSKKLEVAIDWVHSDFDGDGKKNAADKNPLDPKKS